MTFTAEPNIGPYLVEETPPNLLEHIDEHIKFLRECKITFTGSIGRGDIPHTKSAMTLLNNIDVLIAGEGGRQGSPPIQQRGHDGHHTASHQAL